MNLKAEAYGRTDIGKKREHNEDAFAADPSTGVFVVADGMGGHAAGEVASARAVAAVAQQIAAGREVLSSLSASSTPEARAKAAELVEFAIQRACSEIYRLAKSDAAKRGMGTTLACLVLAGTKAVIGHVGDSRVYLLRSGQCHRLTEDHTLVAAQMKAGTLTRDQAQISQFRNVVTRAVGIQESVEVDTLIVDLLPRDRFLLCSDGLHGHLADEELPALLAEPELSVVPGRLVGLANERGGRDNITVVVVELSDTDGSSPELEETTSRMDALRKIPIFRHLTYKEQTAILSIASSRSFQPGEEILVEHQPGEDMFIVVKGRVSVLKDGVGIAEVRAGGHFGEMGLIDNAPRSATVRADEPTRAMVIPRGDLMRLMKREPILAVKLLWSFVQVLSDRLRTTNDELLEVRQEERQDLRPGRPPS